MTTVNTCVVKPKFRLLRPKRVLDLAICVVMLPAVLPVLGAAAAAVALTSKGSVFFVQERVGGGG
ncbi:MAG: sugar transferase, partial [Marinomonas sp.]